jgi:hypothetical protein
MTLDECNRSLRSKLGRSGSISRRGRVPSWSVMSRESLPASDSTCLAAKVDAAVEQHRETTGDQGGLASPRYIG